MSSLLNFMGGTRFAKLKPDIALTPEEAAEVKRVAAIKKRRKEKLLRYLDVRNLDIFGYAPNYTFPGYRSTCGSITSLMLAMAVFLRVSTRGMDFIKGEAVVYENVRMFPRDMQSSFALPKLGFVFKKTGWKPFYDPTYFRFRFQQGYSGRASNSSYTDLGDQPCSFVDAHGRILEDEARCPAVAGQVLGNFFDDRFRFLHASILRCHNGTDAAGRPKPGPCRRPDEIDKLMWEGTITMAISQTDLDVASAEEYANLVMMKKTLRSNIHVTYDMYFTVRFVTQQPRAFFDSLDTLHSKREYVTLERTEASFTDFRPVKIGRWNKADPNYVPQYAAFFLVLSDELVDQQRKFLSVFQLIESWGASVMIFYFFFSFAASRWNHSNFSQQVKGLDLRDLSRDQFDQFGRLVDRSFQVPRELQDLDTVANVK